MTTVILPGRARAWSRMDRLRARQRRTRRRLTWTAVAVVCGTGYILVTTTLASFTGGWW